MLNEQSLKELNELFGEEQVKAMQAYSVWRQQQLYTDEQLWERLYQFHDREIEILRQLPLAYQLGHSDLKDYLYWRAFWLRLNLELEIDRDTKKLYVWHLTQRGDPNVSQWLEECEEYKRANNLKWQRAAWGNDDE